MMEALFHPSTTTTDTDFLGPVSVSEASAVLQDLPEFTGAHSDRFATWAGETRTPQAHDLCRHLCLLLNLPMPDAGGLRGRGRPPKISAVLALEAFVGDLMVAARDGKWILTRMTPSAYDDSIRVGYDIAKKVFDAMRRGGFIEVERGYASFAGNPGQLTRSRGTPSLFRLAATHGLSWREARSHFDIVEDPAKKARPAIEVRAFKDKDTDGKQVLPVPDTREARRLQTQVEDYNAFVSGFCIESGTGGCRQRHYPVFQRIFHGDLKFWGRLYDGRPSYQQLENKLGTRASMTIDGEPTVELDVHASGLTILHGLGRVPMPSQYDLYSLPGHTSREAVKLLVNTSIGRAGRAVASWPRNVNPALVEGQDAKATWAAIKKAYPWIDRVDAVVGASHFPERTASLLAAKEADAVLGAVFDLQAKGILALPVFDSLIVQARHGTEARDALERNYQRVAGVTPRVRIK